MTKKRDREKVESEIISEWDRWSKEHAPGSRKSSDAMAFYQYLVKERQGLFRYPTALGPGDPWQVVKGILIHAGLIDT